MSARLTKFGFTLIELLVVISIIGILATLVAANLNSARSRARDAQRKSDMRNVGTALRLYYNDKATYPTYPAQFAFGAEFISGTTTYMDMVPNDPLYNANDSPPIQYVYVRDEDGDGFTLKACLENASDSQGIAASGITCSSSWMFQVKQ
jgi:prepilin-type N-terminal cleavage/methylation domain-containing protein